MPEVTRLEFNRLKSQVDNLIFQLMPIGLTGEVSIPESALQIGAILGKLQRFKGAYWFNSTWDVGHIDQSLVGTGTLSWSSGYVSMTTGTTSLSSARISKTDYGYQVIPTWDKERWFGLRVVFGNWTNQIIHLVTGSVSGVDAVANTARHIGFKVDNASLYATVANGTSETTSLIRTLTDVITLCLEVHLEPANAATFYENDIQVAVLTTNLPSGASLAGTLLWASIHNIAAEDKGMSIYTNRIYQEG